MSATRRGAHSHGHRDGPVMRASRHTRVVFAALLIPALVATVVGLVLLWPSSADLPERHPATAEGSTYETVVVDGTLDEQAATYPVRTAQGSRSAMRSPGGPIVMEPGDHVVAMYIADLAEDGAPYVFVDFERKAPIAILAAAYALVVVLVARWRGLAALCGLALAFTVILGFTIPALLAGESPILVALVTSTLIMFATLYLAHGLNARTSTALLGTLAGLALTAGLGSWATRATHMGYADEESAWLLSSAQATDLGGIALCGLVLAGMGVLNDVTITQASAVWELRTAAPGASRRELFVRAMRIGRDHIASTVYTMAFAYVGAALPLIMLTWMVEQPPLTALTLGEIAEEVVRTLVGSVGLVLAIPATTAIAALAVPARTGREPAGESPAPDADADRPIPLGSSS